MGRFIVRGAALGLLNALAVMAVVFLTNPSLTESFGWFAYTPLPEGSPAPPVSPWTYALLPPVLVLLNALVVTLYGRRGTP